MSQPHMTGDHTYPFYVGGIKPRGVIIHLLEIFLNSLTFPCIGAKAATRYGGYLATNVRNNKRLDFFG